MNSPLDAIAAITDPATRAVEATTFSAHTQEQGRRARRVRDDAVRELRKAGETIPSIARLTGINIATVKVILR